MKKLLFILLMGMLFASCGFYKEYDVKVDGLVVRAYDKVDRFLKIGDTVRITFQLNDDIWVILNDDGNTVGYYREGVIKHIDNSW